MTSKGLRKKCINAIGERKQYLTEFGLYINEKEKQLFYDIG
jgi:hypothetical protein